MTEEEKDWIRAMLESKAELMGIVTAENVQELTQYKALWRAVNSAMDQGRSAAGVAWAWIAERQEAGCMRVDSMLTRKPTGSGSTPIPRWEWYSKAASGWSREEGLTLTTALQMRDLDMVLTHLITAEEGMG